MSPDPMNDPRNFLKSHWEALPAYLQTLIVIGLILMTLPGWLILLFFKIWFYHWE